MINPNNFYTIQGWMLSDLQLKGNALAAYAIIYGFSQDGKSEFTGSARYLAEWMGCSRSTVMDTLKKLVEKGLLEKRDIYQDGVLNCAYKANLRPCPKSGQGVSEIQTEGCPKSGQGVSENQTGGCPKPGHNNIADIDSYIDNIKNIVEYLNRAAGKKYKHSTKETRQHIKARLAEGYTLEDFKTVIDKMCSKWKGDPKMEDYLRPATLFGTKFESYLNATAAPPQRARPAGRGGYPGQLGPNGIPIDPTKNDLDGIF